MYLCDQWRDYEVLDTGDGEKLERWGNIILRRPDPQVIWPKADPELWKKAQWDGETGITQEGDIPWIWLANIDHLYWSRENLNVAEQKLHPHGHGWSVVNNVDQWTWD